MEASSALTSQSPTPFRDILSFIDVQDYNTPRWRGWMGKIYQPGSVDYHAA